MARSLGCLTALALLAAMIVAAGCSSDPQCPKMTSVSPTLLFGNEPTAPLATRLARSPWPATDGPYVAPEETFFVEYYRDYFGGNAAQEQTNPQRQFRSYRIGATQR